MGRCGFYCGACEIHRAFKDSPPLRIELAKKYGCQPGEVHCEGCQVLNVGGWSRSDKWGANCEILECLHDRGHDSCHQCPDTYTCERWAALAEQYLMQGMDLRANLERIKKGEVDEWLASMEQRWRCQECDRPIIVSPDHEHCHWCGAYQL